MLVCCTTFVKKLFLQEWYFILYNNSSDSSDSSDRSDSSDSSGSSESSDNSDSSDSCDDYVWMTFFWDTKIIRRFLFLFFFNFCDDNFLWGKKSYLAQLQKSKLWPSLKNSNCDYI